MTHYTVYAFEHYWCAKWHLIFLPCFAKPSQTGELKGMSPSSIDNRCGKLAMLVHKAIEHQLLCSVYGYLLVNRDLENFHIVSQPRSKANARGICEEIYATLSECEEEAQWISLENLLSSNRGCLSIFNFFAYLAHLLPAAGKAREIHHSFKV